MHRVTDQEAFDEKPVRGVYSKNRRSFYTEQLPVHWNRYSAVAMTWQRICIENISLNYHRPIVPGGVNLENEVFEFHVPIPKSNASVVVATGSYSDLSSENRDPPRSLHRSSHTYVPVRCARVERDEPCSCDQDLAETELMYVRF